MGCFIFQGPGLPEITENGTQLVRLRWRREARNKAGGRAKKHRTRVWDRERQTPNPERETWNLGLEFNRGERETRVAKFLPCEMNVLVLARQNALWKGRECTSFLTCCPSPRSRHGIPRHPIVLAPATGWVPDCGQADGGDYRPAAGAEGKSSNACRPPWHPARGQSGLRSDWLTVGGGRSLLQFRFRSTGETPGTGIPRLLSTRTREGQTYLNEIVTTCLSSQYLPMKSN